MGKIKTQIIKIPNQKIAGKIVLISDIHYYSKKDLNKLNKVLTMIKDINPNYICILGDTCDQARILDEDLLIDWLSKLAQVNKVIMVYGNHDLALYKEHVSYFNEKLFNKIRQIKNLYLLDNKIREDSDICFIGLKLDYAYYYETKEDEYEFVKHYNKVVKKLNSDKYNILLTHSPIALTQDGVIKKLNDYQKLDLILCGHMHGGLMPKCLRSVFKNNGLVSPNKHKLLIKNAYGSFKIGNINFIVSDGVTKLSHVSKMSFFDRLFSPEIVLIELEK